MKIIVNLITLTRLIGVLIIPLLSQSISEKALILYIAFLLVTDFIDGFLARKYKVSTLFGSLFDTFSDKVLSLFLLLLIYGKYKIMILLILGEVLISIINLGGALAGTHIASSKLGKIKTFILSLIIFVSFVDLLDINYSFISIFNNNSSVLINVLTIIVSVISFATAFDYLKKHLKFPDKININHYKLKDKESLKHVLFNTEYFHETINEPLVIKIGEMK